MAIFDFVGNGTPYLNNASGNSISLSRTVSAAGNLIVIGGRWEGGGAPDTATIGFTGGGISWSTLRYDAVQSGGEDQRVFACWGQAVSSGVLSVTGTISANRAFREAYIVEYEAGTGFVISEIIAQGNRALDGATTWSLSAFTALVNDLISVVHAGYNSGAVVAFGSPLTLRDNTNGLLDIGDYKVTSGGSVTPSGTITPGDSYATIGLQLRASTGNKLLLQLAQY